MRLYRDMTPEERAEQDRLFAESLRQQQAGLKWFRVKPLEQRSRLLLFFSICQRGRQEK